MPTTIHGVTVYTVQEAAKELHLSTNTVHKYIRNGRLKAQKIGKAWLISEASIREILGPLFDDKNTITTEVKNVSDGEKRTIEVEVKKISDGETKTVNVEKTQR